MGTPVERQAMEQDVVPGGFKAEIHFAYWDNNTNIAPFISEITLSIVLAHHLIAKCLILFHWKIQCLTLFYKSVMTSQTK